MTPEHAAAWTADLRSQLAKLVEQHQTEPGMTAKQVLPLMLSEHQEHARNIMRELARLDSAS